MLQPLDIVVSLALVYRDGSSKSLEQLGAELGISGSTAFRSLERAKYAGLVSADRHLNRANMLELLVHGVRFVYYVKPGELTRGVPTAHAAPPLAARMASDQNPPVWPDPEGEVRGQAVVPLHESAPRIARHDHAFYEVLALIDGVRLGGARVRTAATDLLRHQLEQ